MIAYFFTLMCVFSRLIKILDSTRARAALNDVRPPNILKHMYHQSAKPRRFRIHVYGRI